MKKSKLSVKTMGEIDQFVAQTYKISESLVITIPAEIVAVTGLKAKDIIKVWFRKVGK